MKRILAFICVMACLLGLALPAMAAPEGMITVTAQVPADWTNVHLYAWVDDTNNLGAWPGTPMNKTDDGRYTIDIPMEYPYIIVNNGEGGAQTQDMSFDGISDVWVIVSGGSGEVLYYDPGVVENNGGGSAAGELTSVALVGEGVDALKWEPDNADCEMTQDGEGVWTKDLSLYKGTTIKFKLCGNDAWDAGFNMGGNADGIVAASGTAIELLNSGDSKDISFTASQDCTLTVKLDMNGDVPTVTVTETPADLGPAPDGGNNGGVAAGLNSVALVGEGIDALKWEPDNADLEMTMISEGVWTKELSLTNGTTIKFKLCGNDAWDAGFNMGANADGIVAVSGTAIELISSSDSKDISFTATQDGTVTVKLDMTGAVPTVTVTEGGFTPIPTPDPDPTPDPEPTQPTQPTEPSKPAETKPAEDKTAENEGGVDIFMIITFVMAGLAVAAVVVTVIIIKKKG